MSHAKSIMFLGTGSDVGKSITATAFCRILHQRGIHVSPFKAQNMSNNSFVTLEGGEIGRAQAAQAEASGLIPSVHMNPILLKPTGDMGSQIVVHGKVFANLSAKAYYNHKPMLIEKVMQSYEILSSTYDAIIMEGAGSCSEINLRSHDIVNFEIALKTNTPVILIADIDKGGVFAQIIGTFEVIDKNELDLVMGVIINKFRGDIDLFNDGIRYIEQRTGKPVLGIVPYDHHQMINTEDSMSLNSYMRKTAHRQDKINIAVLRLPHISNCTDIEPLTLESEVSINWVDSPNHLDDYDIIIIPGSKNVIQDISELIQKGWQQALHDYIQKTHGMLIGLCGGFQMLGQTIQDPYAIEGSIKKIKGFGFLACDTIIEQSKVVKCTDGQESLFQSYVRGYEIHMGKTTVAGNHFLLLDGHQEGACSDNKRIIGTYLHGLFDSGIFRWHLIHHFAMQKQRQLKAPTNYLNYWDIKENHYNHLADHFKRYTNAEKIVNTLIH